MTRRAITALVFAFVVSALALYGVGAFAPSPAAALDPSTFPKLRPPTADEVRAFKIVRKFTETGTEAQKGTARKIMQRSIERAAPRVVANVVGRGGLVGVAVGVWAVVGLELYYLPCWECQSEVIKVSMEQSFASGARAVKVTTSGDTQGVLLYAAGHRNPDGTVRIQFVGVRNVVSWRKATLDSGTKWEAGTPALYPVGSINLPTTYKDPWTNISAYGDSPPPYTPTVANVSVTTTNKPGDVAVRIAGGDKYFDQVVCASGLPCTTARFPGLQSGSWKENGTYTGNPLKLTPEEGNGLITSVVADPETLPLIEQEPSQEPFPEDFPDDPFGDPYENPDGDPDEDGIPSKDDPDPEGDGDPDGDGNPNEHPYLVPPDTINPDSDDDGIPDKDDSDDDNDGMPDEYDPNPLIVNPPPDSDRDGEPDKTDPDDDNDGIPDQDDPEPLVPTDPVTLPPAHPYGDPDRDGTPNKDDGDDDQDGIPDQDDPEPVVPTDPITLPPEHPYGDPDKDGVPNKDDGDDDQDGIPDQDDPEPVVPTDPNTLPPEHPYGDPDRDGVPNKDDRDDDNDGTPDEGDTAPTNPDEGGDLDRDGIPDRNDGDEDGDGVPDWEDKGERDNRVPVPPGEIAPDLDEDTVPDWSDPWPENPWAPADPTKDGDGDRVPDYKDPNIPRPDVPMQPWPPGTPGDTPDNPGEPNIVPQPPPNPNYPTSPTIPANPNDETTWPSDPTSPVNQTTPINPVQPMPPGQPGGPPGVEVPPPPPPTEVSTSCPVPRESSFTWPTLNIGDVFPFSLVVFAWGVLTDLTATPEAPSFQIPFFGTLATGGAMDSMMSIVRGTFAVVFGVGMALWFYRYVSGKGSDG